MRKGFFITLEGGEGSGKSTQAKHLSEKLQGEGRSVVLTREPGGTPQGEKLRSLLVQGNVDQWTPAAEAMLNSAARSIHVRDVIAPALSAGQVVLSDRFMDSTRAYQGFAGGCSMKLINQLEVSAVGTCVPDLTLIFDLDPVVGLERAQTRGQGIEDRFERKGLAFHRALREGFQSIAKANPKRCVLINANASPNEVFQTCWLAIERRLHG